MKREDVPSAIRKLADRAANGGDRDPDHGELSDLVTEAEDEARRIRATTSSPMGRRFADELDAAVGYAQTRVWPKEPNPPTSDDAA